MLRTKNGLNIGLCNYDKVSNKITVDVWNSCCTGMSLIISDSTANAVYNIRNCVRRSL